MLLTGKYMRLLTHHTFALDLLHLAVGIGDDPVAVNEPGGQGPRVANSDGVGKHVACAVGLGLIWKIEGFSRDLNAGT